MYKVTRDGNEVTRFVDDTFSSGGFMLQIRGKGRGDISIGDVEVTDLP
jgi:hypothetical protein